jgi:hypothetical protein
MQHGAIPPTEGPPLRHMRLTGAYETNCWYHTFGL